MQNIKESIKKLAPGKPGRVTNSDQSTIPPITWLVIAICTVIFLFANYSREFSNYDRVMDILVPSALDIWAGRYWGLLTSAFVHIAFWHILFNMWWAKDMGTLLETTMGRFRYVLFIVTSAVVSSGAELAVTGELGIGFSGVVYAMFGYMFASRDVVRSYRRIVTDQITFLFLAWLILCIVLTYTNVWRIGNAAHIAGLLFGYFVANVFTVRVRVRLSKIGLAALCAVTVLSAAYMPWSPSWDYRSASAIAEAAANGNSEAQETYAEILAADGKKAESLSWLRKSADQGNLSAMNDLAWTLATDRDDPIRDGTAAVKLAEAVCEKTDWKDPRYLDTLSAAYAEVERWDDAVATQKMAVSKLDDEESKASFEARLRQYLRREKARD